MALWQPKGGPEQRADEKPAISDLRESGSLEQDADMVILLHRESAYRDRFYKTRLFDSMARGNALV